jgi:hypothetical protein
LKRLKLVSLIVAGVMVIFVTIASISMMSAQFRTSTQRVAEMSLISTEFVDSKVLFPNSEPPVYDFLVMQGTSAHLTIEYDYTNATLIPAYLDTPNLYIEEFNNSTKLVTKLNPAGADVDVPYNSTGWRMYISSPSDLRYFYQGDAISKVQITYTVDVDASAENATYGLSPNLSRSRQLITIGDEHYNGPNPWE